jgi:hypothetical protein
MPEVIIQTVSKMPMKHQIAKLLVGTIAGFAAAKWSDKAYDAVYKCVQNNKIVTPQ